MQKILLINNLTKGSHQTHNSKQIYILYRLPIYSLSFLTEQGTNLSTQHEREHLGLISITNPAQKSRKNNKSKELLLKIEITEITGLLIWP